MKIGMLEFLYHHIFLYSLAIVAKESGADVTIFTTKKLYNLVIPLFKDKIKNYRWVIKREDESRTSFLKRVEGIVNKEIDLLFINTIQGNLCFQSITFRPKCKNILVTGRVEEWLGNKYKPNTFRPRGFIGYNMRYFSRKIILRRFNNLLVHTESLKNYVVKKGYKKEVFVFPFTIYNGDVKLKVDFRRIKFIVLGAVDETRRDYILILKIFEKIFKCKNKNIELVLLGRTMGNYGKKIIEYSQQLQKRGVNIKFYNKYVPEDVYYKETISSDIIINPIRLEKYPHGGYTAGMVDAIRYGKPGIYPNGYIVEKRLISSSMFYRDNDDLYHLIKKIINNKIFLENLVIKAKENSEKFSLENMTKYFRENILEKFN